MFEKYNCFILQGKLGYARMMIFYSNPTNPSEIEGITAQFSKKKVRFLKIPNLDAISLVFVRKLIKAMRSSTNFKEVFKKKFNLSVTDSRINLPRTGSCGDYNSNKLVLNIEIERTNLTKRGEI